MTKFEELMDIINRKKGISKTPLSDSNDSHELEVAGSEGSKSPLLECGDDEIDGSIIEELYKKFLG